MIVDNPVDNPVDNFLFIHRVSYIINVLNDVINRTL